MNKQDCIKAIREASQGTMSREEAADLLERMINASRARAEKKAIPPGVALAQITEEFQLEEKALVALDKRNRLLSESAYGRQKAFAQQFPKWAAGVKAALGGGERLEKGASLGVWQLQRQQERKFLSRLEAELERDDVLEDFVHGRHEEDVFREMWNVQGGGVQSVTGNQSAFKIARIAHGIQKSLVGIQNRWGAWITELKNYGFTQTHDRDRLRRDGFQNFRAFVAGLDIDTERTYQGMDPDKFWSFVYRNLVTGVHEKAVHEFDPTAPAQVHGSLARRLSESRVIHFANPDSQFKYHQRYGAGRYDDLVRAQIHRGARAISLMQAFGPNPRATFERLVDDLKTEARDILPPDEIAGPVKALESATIEGYWKLVSGESEVSKSPSLTRWVSAIRNWTVTAKLGAVTLSSFSDKVFVQNQMAAMGIKRLDRFIKQFEAMLPPDTYPEKATLLRAMAVVSHSFSGHTSARFAYDPNTREVGRGMVETLMKLNGFNYWNDTSQRAMADAIAWQLGEHADVAYGQLPAELQRAFKQYDISPGEWDAIRSTAWSFETQRPLFKEMGADTTDFEIPGVRYITPDRLRVLPESTIDALLMARGSAGSVANRSRYRDELENKLYALVVDQTDAAMNAPDLRTRFWTTWGGQQQGTLARAAADLVMLFKSFPISVALRLYGRAVHGEGAESIKDTLTSPRAYWRVAQLLAMTGIAGYISMTAKDLLRGRTPRALFNEDDGSPNGSVWMASLLQGGGLGIYSDLLFNSYDRRVRTPLGALSGPVLGQLDPALSLFSDTRDAILDGDIRRLEKFGYRAERLVEYNLPFANLFYVRPVLDYFIFWQLSEMLSPGVLRRMKRTVRKENHQDFWIEPKANLFED